MYISQIHTDYRKLRDIYELHQLLWKGFDVGDKKQQRDFLFRAERKPAKQAEILVQSQTRPNWEPVFSPRTFAVKSYEPVFKAGQRFFFLIQVSGSVAKSNGPGTQPRRVPLPWSQYESWFKSQGEKRGFEVLNLTRLGEVFASSYAKKRVSIAGQKLSGVLTVTKPDAFEQSYRQGIGRGKGFGFGMLSLKRC